MSDTALLPDLEEELSEFDGMAHYARVRQLIAGGPVEALCGKRYIPTVIAGAEKMPVCPKCKELMAMLEDMFGDE